MFKLTYTREKKILKSVLCDYAISLIENSKFKLKLFSVHKVFETSTAFEFLLNENADLGLSPFVTS